MARVTFSRGPAKRVSSIAGLALLSSSCMSLKQQSDGVGAAPQRLPTAQHTQAEYDAAWRPVASGSERTETILWWEAERPSSTNFPPQHSFSPVGPGEVDLLSGGAWIGTDAASLPAFLEYELSIPSGSASVRTDFEFLVRKFWLHGPFRWRFDDGAWRECTREAHILESVTIRPNVAASWISLGHVALAPGRHHLRVELTEAGGPAAFDAFVLSAGGFGPHGRLKPGERGPAPPPGWHAFLPRADSFAASRIDLRALNQARAGIDGRLIKRDSELVFANSGAAVRLWGMNVGPDVLSLPPELLQRYARHAAKFGVNLIRLHAPVFQGDSFRTTDKARVDAIQALANALNAEGIYLALSIYFPAWLHLGAKDGIAGYAGESPYGLSFFNEDFENVERSWWRELLTKPNPKTGTTLAADPGIAYVELLNEDSTLFWTFRPHEQIPEAQSANLELQFGRWLTAKYGSIENAAARWHGKPIKGDDFSAGRVGVLGADALASDASPRAQDSAEFLSRLMRDHYTRLQDFIRKDLGFGGLTVCSNWQTSNEQVLGPLDNWANAVCDVMDRHAYQSGPHEGDAAGWAVQDGQRYDDGSSLIFPGGPGGTNGIPAFVEPRYDGKPALVSELGWPWPNRFRAEGPLLVSLYGRLTGLDGPIWFASGQPGWASVLEKFEIKEPATFGQFPAAALIFRKGLVSEGPPVGSLELGDQELFTLHGLPFSVGVGLDTFRKSDVPQGPGSAADAWALLRGPLDVQLGTSPGANSKASPVALAERPTDGSLVSGTNELTWNHKSGVVTAASARAEVALGFVGRSDVQLPVLTLHSQNDYAAAALVALDDAPLPQSRHMLLQVATEVTNTAWAAPGTGTRTIQHAGSGPILTRDLQGSIELRRPDARALHITALDANMQPSAQWQQNAGEVLLLPDVMYYEIEAPAPQ